MNAESLTPAQRLLFNRTLFLIDHLCSLKVGRAFCSAESHNIKRETAFNLWKFSILFRDTYGV